METHGRSGQMLKGGALRSRPASAGTCRNSLRTVEPVQGRDHAVHVNDAVVRKGRQTQRSQVFGANRLQWQSPPDTAVDIRACRGQNDP